MVGELLIKPITDTVEPIAKAVGGTLADFWQGVVGDPVFAWRIRNAVKIEEKLRDELAASGHVLKLDNLPEGVAFRWFGRATEAEEPEIQELFAKLLVNAASGNEDALRKRNIDLVSNLTPDDAQLLSFIASRYAEFHKTRAARYDPFAIKYDWMFEREYKAAGFTSGLPIDALLSLGIWRLERNFRAEGRDIASAISVAVKHGRGSDFGLAGMLEEEEKLVLTGVGKSLLQALFPSEMAQQPDIS